MTLACCCKSQPAAHKPLICCDATQNALTSVRGPKIPNAFPAPSLQVNICCLMHSLQQMKLDSIKQESYEQSV